MLNFYFGMNNDLYLMLTLSSIDRDFCKETEC